MVRRAVLPDPFAEAEDFERRLALLMQEFMGDMIGYISMAPVIQNFQIALQTNLTKDFFHRIDNAIYQSYSTDTIARAIADTAVNEAYGLAPWRYGYLANSITYRPVGAGGFRIAGGKGYLPVKLGKGKASRYEVFSTAYHAKFVIGGRKASAQTGYVEPYPFIQYAVDNVRKNIAPIINRLHQAQLANVSKAVNMVTPGPMQNITPNITTSTTYAKIFGSSGIKGSLLGGNLGAQVSEANAMFRPSAQALFSPSYNPADVFTNMVINKGRAGGYAGR